ncbi:MAG: signal peptidase I [Solirubrobacteraceae bacterium]
MSLRRLARGNRVVEFVLIVAIALALAFGLQAFVVKPYQIPSGSMEPTLAVGQRVLVDRIGNDFFAPSVGDIVVFHPPAGAPAQICGNTHEKPGQPCDRPTPRESSQNYIKRVVAGPGDTIKIIAGHVWLNGKLQKERFANFAGCTSINVDCNYPTPITIPAGYYFMMGDNRDFSDDSRFWGPVPRSWIIGEAFFTYWPPDRIGFL